MNVKREDKVNIPKKSLSTKDSLPSTGLEAENLFILFCSRAPSFNILFLWRWLRKAFDSKIS